MLNSEHSKGPCALQLLSFILLELFATFTITNTKAAIIIMAKTNLKFTWLFFNISPQLMIYELYINVSSVFLFFLILIAK